MAHRVAHDERFDSIKVSRNLQLPIVNTISQSYPIGSILYSNGVVKVSNGSDINLLGGGTFSSTVITATQTLQLEENHYTVNPSSPDIVITLEANPNKTGYFSFKYVGVNLYKAKILYGSDSCVLGSYNDAVTLVSDGVDIVEVGEKLSKKLALMVPQGDQLSVPPQLNLWFASSVSLSADGNTVIIGAYGEDGQFTNAGAAYIFTRNGGTWSAPTRIEALTPLQNATFGASVSLSADGNTAIVGASGENTAAGAAYIFTRNGETWSAPTRIEALTPQSNAGFGYSVCLSADGNTAIVGAYLEDTNGGAVTNVGAAYIFTRNGGTWSAPTRIEALTPLQNYQFGISVSLSADGNTAIVGSYLEHTTVSDNGVAYIFTRNGGTWSAPERIVGVVQEDAYFGYSVSLSADGNTAIVGAYLEIIDAISNAGAVYIFTRNGGGIWAIQQKLVGSPPQAGANFGYSLSLSADGNTAIVGAYAEDDPVSNAGSVYVFTRNGETWSLQQKIRGAIENDQYGRSVSLNADGNTAIVGATLQDAPANAGAAYIFV